MQKDAFFEACINDPKFVEKNCFMQPLDMIDYHDHEEANEARVNLKKRPVLADQLKNYIAEGNKFQGLLRPNIVPVTVSGPKNARTQDDGYNRLREILELAKENPEITHIFAIEARHENQDGRPATSARTWSMLNDNIGLDEAPATDADIVNAAVVDIKDNLRLGSDYGNVALEDVVSLIQGELKYPLHGNKANSLGLKVLEQLPEGSKKLKNYGDKDAAIEIFNELNEWGLKPTHPGATCVDSEGTEWVVYFAGTRTWINQNLIHGVWNQNLKNHEPPKVMVVGFNERIWSAKGSLCEFRKKQVEDIKNHNNHPWLPDNQVVVSRYCALPQIIKGRDKEDMSVLHLIEDFTK